MQNRFQFQNNLLGWLVFLAAAVVYGSTIEPTASFWDCGEYIACSYGLEVGHPPGAPLFLVIARIFGMLGGPAHAAWMINMMSALCSAATILFLFWTITRIARKVLLKTEEDYATKSRLVLLAGAVGALAFTFTDSFWFSAVEGEVYAMSSLFTAIVFWAILRWEAVADEPHADRWLILIAYFIGLSIGVHLLNLLTIPALVFVWYFRKNKKITRKGFLLASLAALGLLGVVQNGIIPGVVKLAAKAELFFVNNVGLPFNSGTVIYFVLLLGLLSWGIWFTQRKGRAAWNTALLSFAVLLIGYSSFLVIVIRAQAGTPINENNPSNAISLLSYLNREQYGDWPLLYGQHYATPLDPEEPYGDGEPLYARDDKSGKYIIIDARKGEKYNYDSDYKMFFPRMWSSNASHVSAYKEWAQIEGVPTEVTKPNGEKATVLMPTFGDNLAFFGTYQVWFMYGRYFLWNFVGRQNDLLGYGSALNGWPATGAGFIDNRFLVNHDMLPESLKNNKAYNGYFGIPLLMGILGIVWLLARSRRDTFVLFLLFAFTGLAIVVYLNQTPYQPRERDYAYTGSFYAFAIFIGFGALQVLGWFDKLNNRTVAFSLASLISAGTPLVLAVQNWDDHDRSHRTVAQDIAWNMLQSCPPNAVLFTYADNDTFPLWYLQEVEGVRRDVRVICLSLFSSDWHIDQMQRKQYDSEPLPFLLKHDQYREGTRDFVFIENDILDMMDARDAMQFVAAEDTARRLKDYSGEWQNYIPSRGLFLPVNKENVRKSGLLPQSQQNRLADTIRWNLRGGYMLKDQVMILDLLAHHNWQRPICYAAGMPGAAYSGLNPYLQQEGLVYRLIPVLQDSASGQPGGMGVNSDAMYRNMKTHFRYGHCDVPGVYLDETVQRFFTDPMRGAALKLSEQLLREGQPAKAAEIARTCLAKIPAENAPVDDSYAQLVAILYECGDAKNAGPFATHVFKEYESQLRFIDYVTHGEKTPDGEKYSAMLQRLQWLAKTKGDAAQAATFLQTLGKYGIPEYVEVPDTVKDSVKDSVGK